MMAMEKPMMMMQTIYLFGKRVDAEVEVEAPEPLRARTPGGLELPPGARRLARKRLEKSDVTQTQSKLLIPCDVKVVEGFLTELEKALIMPPPWEEEEKEKGLGSKTRGLGVAATDNDGREYRLSCSYWPRPKKYVLNRGWNKVVSSNRLQKGDMVEIWCYRLPPPGPSHYSPLCFAVDICERNIPAQDIMFKFL